MRDNCGICGESYDEDNLERCTQCGRDYCYKCGGLGVCQRCREKKEQAEKPEATPPFPTAPQSHQGGISRIVKALPAC